MRGARRNPSVPVSSAEGSARETAISARSPGLAVADSAARPWRTRRRFSPASGTRSATVASATRSRSSSAAARPERRGELVGDPGPAQRRARVARQRRMDDRAVGQRTVGARCVVIGDDHVHTGGPSGRDLVDRGDAAVDGHDQGGPALGQALHGGRGQAVAVVDAAGQEPARLGAEAAQGPDHDRGGAHPVDVVVAVDDDGPTGGDVAADEIERLLDAVKSGRVVGLPAPRGSAGPPPDRPARGARGSVRARGPRPDRAPASARRRRHRARSGAAEPDPVR